MPRTLPDHDTTDYDNSLIATLVMSAFALAAGVLLGLALFVAIERRLGANAAYALLAPYAIVWLWLSESWWFALTTRRFARIHDDTLTLYGAFGRARWQGSISAHRFSFENFRGTPNLLGIESADGRMRRYLLTLCRDRSPLLNKLAASNHLTDLRQGKIQPPLILSKRLGYWFMGYFFFLLFCSVIGMVESELYLFRQLRPLPSAWHGSIFISVIVMLPLAVLLRYVLRDNRWFNLPDYHYWRKNRFGNAVAEILYYLRYGALVAGLTALCASFIAYNIALISLQGRPYQTLNAESQTVGKCSWGKTTWRLHTRLPPEYRRFDGAWCSWVRDSNPPPPRGTYTVYLRESALAQELRFDEP